MLTVAACALLGLALVILLAKARRTRWALLVAALAIAAAVLIAVQLHRVDRRVKAADAWWSEECQTVARELAFEASGYRMKSADSATPRMAVTSMEDEYRGALSERLRIVEICAPAIRSGWQAMDCLPPALNDRTVQNVERAAAAIKGRSACDTRAQ